jgi:hypothetical protein
MKTEIRLLLIIIVTVGGFYASIWFGFFGGIIQLVKAVYAANIVPWDIAVAVARIVFSMLVAFLICSWVNELFFGDQP